MNDKTDDIQDIDLDELEDVVGGLGDEEDWESELSDDLDDVIDVDSDDEADADADEEDEDEDGDESLNLDSSDTTETKSSKKKILPLAVAAVAIVGVASFIVLGNTNSGGNSRIGEESISSAAKIPDQQLSLDQSSATINDSGNPALAVDNSDYDGNGLDDSITVGRSAESDSVSASSILDQGGSSYNADEDIISDVVDDSPIHEAENVVYVEGNDSLTPDDVRLVVEDALSSVKDELAQVNTSQYVHMLSQISSELGTVNKKLAELESKKPNPGSDEVVRLSPEEVSVITRDRMRIPGSRVVSTSQDGLMSIVETIKPERNRISVFFKGEKIIVSGSGVMDVTDVVDGGHLVLVGDGLYIDDVLEKRAVKAPKQDKGSDKSIKKISGNEVKPLSKRNDENNVSPKALAEGWLVNGVYNGKYLVQTPSGEWLSVKEGDTLEGLGVVIGADSANALEVGNYKIEILGK